MDIYTTSPLLRVGNYLGLGTIELVRVYDYISTIDECISFITNLELLNGDELHRFLRVLDNPTIYTYMDIYVMCWGLLRYTPRLSIDRDWIYTTWINYIVRSLGIRQHQDVILIRRLLNILDVERSGWRGVDKINEFLTYNKSLDSVVTIKGLVDLGLVILRPPNKIGSVGTYSQLAFNEYTRLIGLGYIRLLLE
jgi:hypothetical protein